MPAPPPGKYLGQYTARGTVSEQDTIDGIPQRIPLYDGRGDTAYRVTEFKVWGSDYDGSGNPDCIGKLSKNDDGSLIPSLFMRADDNNQIAWAASQASGQSGNAGGFADSIVDPDNLIIEDLYVYARSTNATTTDPVNYLVVMEKYEISEWKGALTMARDRSQGDI